MDASREQVNDSSQPGPSPPAKERRFGACLLDNAAALVIMYGGLQLVSGFGTAFPSLARVFLYVFQACLVGWVVLKDAWWPGQGIGKRMAGVFLAAAHTHHKASRLRCAWRQTISVIIFLALYLTVDLYVLPAWSMVGFALASSLASVAAPVRLLMYLVPAQARSGSEMVIAHFLVLGFMTVEALMVVSRRDGRRIIDLLAGTQVCGTRGKRLQPTNPDRVA